MEPGAFAAAVGGAIGDAVGVAVAVPRKVRVRDGRIEWSVGDDPAGFADGAEAGSVLPAFLRLADPAANDAAFESFARMYGVLGLCPDGLPGTSPVARNRPSAFPPEVPSDLAWRWEPLADWRAYARHALATVALAAALRDGPLSDVGRVLADWGVPADRPPDRPRRPVGWPYGALPGWREHDYRAAMARRRVDGFVTNLDPRSFEATGGLAGALGDNRCGRGLHEWQRLWLAHHASKDWLWHAWLPPTLTWDGGRPALTLPFGHVADLRTPSGWPVNTLFNLLAAQLGAAIASESFVARCDYCGAIYRAARKPRRDRATYCTGCGDRSRKGGDYGDARRRSKRESARRRRGKEKAARSDESASSADRTRPQS